jgi:hypothetical protein
MHKGLIGFAIVAAVGGFIACKDTTAPEESTTYVAILNSANEVPVPPAGPVVSTATGTATYVLKGNELTYTIRVDNALTSSTNQSHIHRGVAGANGPIIVPYTVYAVQNGLVTTGVIDLSKPIAAGGTSVISGDDLKALLNSGGAYTNVHTINNTGGEIRGQIIKQ